LRRVGGAHYTDAQACDKQPLKKPAKKLRAARLITNSSTDSDRQIYIYNF